MRGCRHPPKREDLGTLETEREHRDPKEVREYGDPTSGETDVETPEQKTDVALTIPLRVTLQA